METALSFGAVALFAAAAATDLASRRIANRLVAALAVLGALRIGGSLAAGGGIGPALTDAAAFLGVLGAGAALHRLRLVGGGDVKLLAAGALWLGAGLLGSFLVVTALAGGVLAVGYLVRSRLAAEPPRSLPYGVAIAFAGALCSLSG